MSKWFRKVTGILATILTLGIITPTDFVHREELLQQEALPKSQAERPAEVALPATEEIPFAALSYDKLSWPELSETLSEKQDLQTHFKAYMLNQAQAQAMQKFGPHITKRIGEHYNNGILPQFEKVLEDLSHSADEDLLRHVAVSDQPAAGLGEKILHLYDARNGKDLVRLHVRRENPPKQGYWFNFHYHKHEDDFENHHELGKIYWDKNMPPHWAA